MLKSLPNRTTHIAAATLTIIAIIAISYSFINAKVLGTINEHAIALCEHETDPISKAEILAGDIKYHMSYDYEVTQPYKHNMFTSTGVACYRYYHGKGICTDFCLVYTEMLTAVGVNAEYVDRIPVGDAEHAYVDIKTEYGTFRIDVTSYCTAEEHDAKLGFLNYVVEQ